MNAQTRYFLAVFLVLSLGVSSGCGGGDEEKDGAQGGSGPPGMAGGHGGGSGGGGKGLSLGPPGKAKMGRPDLGGSCPPGGCPGQKGGLSSAKSASVGLDGNDTAGEGEFNKATRSSIASEARKKLAALKTGSPEEAEAAGPPEENDPSSGTEQANPTSGGQEQAEVSVCTMGDYSGPMTPNGLCPKCGMALPKQHKDDSKVESVDPPSAKAPQ